jgi:hypothetical protein
MREDSLCGKIKEDILSRGKIRDLARAGELVGDILGRLYAPQLYETLPGITKGFCQ